MDNQLNPAAVDYARGRLSQGVADTYILAELTQSGHHPAAAQAVLAAARAPMAKPRISNGKALAIVLVVIASVALVYVAAAVKDASTAIRDLKNSFVAIEKVQPGTCVSPLNQLDDTANYPGQRIIVTQPCSGEAQHVLSVEEATGVRSFTDMRAAAAALCPNGAEHALWVDPNSFDLGARTVLCLD